MDRFDSKLSKYIQRSDLNSFRARNVINSLAYELIMEPLALPLADKRQLKGELKPEGLVTFGDVSSSVYTALAHCICASKGPNGRKLIQV